MIFTSRAVARMVGGELSRGPTIGAFVNTRPLWVMLESSRFETFDQVGLGDGVFCHVRIIGTGPCLLSSMAFPRLFLRSSTACATLTG